jgi:hypothetical protein
LAVQIVTQPKLGTYVQLQPTLSNCLHWSGGQQVTQRVHV